jgi:hypothetical protein
MSGKLAKSMYVSLLALALTSRGSHPGSIGV